MKVEKIEILKDIIKTNIIMWNPDSLTAFIVQRIGTHVEEGDNEPCAIFSNGTYAVLSNTSLADFYIVKRLIDYVNEEWIF